MNGDEDHFEGHPDLAELRLRFSGARLGAYRAAAQVSDALSDMLRALIRDGIEPRIRRTGADRVVVYDAFARHLRRWADRFEEVGRRNVK